MLTGEWPKKGVILKCARSSVHETPHVGTYMRHINIWRFPFDEVDKSGYFTLKPTLNNSRFLYGILHTTPYIVCKCMPYIRNSHAYTVNFSRSQRIQFGVCTRGSRIVVGCKKPAGRCSNNDRLPHEWTFKYKLMVLKVAATHSLPHQKRFINVLNYSDLNSFALTDTLNLKAISLIFRFFR